jgi:hypothetical protein
MQLHRDPFDADGRWMKRLAVGFLIVAIYAVLDLGLMGVLKMVRAHLHW